MHTINVINFVCSLSTFYMTPKKKNVPIDERKLIFKSKNCHGKFVYRKVFPVFFFQFFYSLSLSLSLSPSLLTRKFDLQEIYFGFLLPFFSGGFFFIIFRIMILSNQKNDANRKCEGIFVVDISSHQ